MSSIFYMASDEPLEERLNPNCMTLSVNEALARGMRVPDFVLEPGFDRDMPEVILWCDELDTQSKLDNDFAVIPLNFSIGPGVIGCSMDDIYTEKKYQACLEWDYSRGKAEKVIQYIRKQLERTSELEIWHAWIGHGAYPKIRRYTIPINEFTPDDLKELSDFEVNREPITYYCFAVAAD